VTETHEMESPRAPVSSRLPYEIAPGPPSARDHETPRETDPGSWPVVVLTNLSSLT
jgi:hypothetical protein